MPTTAQGTTISYGPKIASMEGSGSKNRMLIMYTVRRIIYITITQQLKNIAYLNTLTNIFHWARIYYIHKACSRSLFLNVIFVTTYAWLTHKHFGPHNQFLIQRLNHNCTSPKVPCIWILSFNEVIWVYLPYESILPTLARDMRLYPTLWSYKRQNGDPNQYD